MKLSITGQLEKTLKEKAVGWGFEDTPKGIIEYLEEQYNKVTLDAIREVIKDTNLPGDKLNSIRHLLS